MKYVLLGNLSPEWANKQSDRVGKAKAKLDKLGIKIESIHAGLLRFRRHRRCAQSGGAPRVLRLVLHPGSGPDPKYAGLRSKGLRNRDQECNGLSAGWKVTGARG
jgi:hypothetical protein